MHFLQSGGMPPGAIGSQALLRGDAQPGFFQPVEIRAPRGALISLVEGGALGPPQPAPVRVGLLVGQVYRIDVANIPFYEGREVYPTIELLGRLGTPGGQELRFPVIVDLTQEDLELAIAGKYVTRVIYLEDPVSALPVRDDPRRQGWFDVRPGQDPLVVAGSLGRPMAIVRMGGRVPDATGGLDSEFVFGSPPLVKFGPPIGAIRPGASSAPAGRPSP
jgi:hypothetical protein